MSGKDGRRSCSDINALLRFARYFTEAIFKSDRSQKSREDGYTDGAVADMVSKRIKGT